MDSREAGLRYIVTKLIPFCQVSVVSGYPGGFRQWRQYKSQKLKSIIPLVQEKSRLGTGYVFLILFALSVFLRLPFFFRDYIDRDESTFILLAESWLNGHLPYTELWDLKPTLVYLFFASIIALFGKSIIAIRMAGALAVALIALSTWAMGKQLGSGKIGLAAALGTVCLLSLFGSLQGVMSEHLSMLAFMPGLYLLIRYRNCAWIMSGGLLFGMALMCKLNLAYAVLALGLYIIYDSFRTRVRPSNLWNPLLFAGGIFLILALCWLPYGLHDKGWLWWNSVFMAPLEYTEARRYSLLKMAPIVLVVAMFFIVGIRKKWLPWKDRSIQILSIALVGVVLSFIKGGRVNGHYLIQFHPLFLLLLGVVLSNALPPISLRWKKWLAILALLIPAESYLEYFVIVKHRIERGTFFNGEGFEVPRYLVKNNLETQSVFFLEYHIGYWYLPADPPTRIAVHPSNLCRDELFPYFNNPRRTSLEELAFIMETIRPELVVTRHGRRIFDKKEVEENTYMNDYLREEYEVISQVGGADIHRRLQ